MTLDLTCVEWADKIYLLGYDSMPIVTVKINGKISFISVEGPSVWW